MLNKQYTSMLQEKDVIFEIFQYATERAKVVGAENIENVKFFCNIFSKKFLTLFTCYSLFIMT